MKKLIFILSLMVGGFVFAEYGGGVGTAALATKADITYVDAGLAGKLSSTGVTAQAYGSVYLHDNTTAVAIVTNAYTQITIWSTNTVNDQAATLNVVALTNGLRVLVSGTYLVNYQVSFSGVISGDIESAILVNGVHQAHAEFDRKLGTGGDVGSASAHGLLYLESNDVVNVAGQALAAADEGNYVARQAQLVVTKAGVTVAEIPIVQTLSGDEADKVPSVAVVNEGLEKLDGNYVVACFGDSNTAGTSAPATPNPKWPETLSSALGSTTNIYGASGDRISQVASAATNAAGLPSASSYDVAVAFVGVNDAPIHTLAEMTNEYVNLRAVLAGQGWDKILHVTYYGWIGYETNLVAFNSWLRTYAVEMGDGLIDHAAAVNDENNTVKDEYVWLNNLHLNQAGADLLAKLAFSKIRSGSSSYVAPAHVGYHFSDSKIVLTNAIGMSFTSRAIGQDGTNAWIASSGAYTNASMVTVSQVCFVAIGSYFGASCMITGAVYSCTVSNEPVGARVDDTIFPIALKPTLTNGVDTTARVVQMGVPLWKVVTTNGAMFDLADIAYNAIWRQNNRSASFAETRVLIQRGGSYNATITSNVPDVVENPYQPILKSYDPRASGKYFTYLCAYNSDATNTMTLPIVSEIRVKRSSLKLDVLPIKTAP